MLSEKLAAVAARLAAYEATGVELHPVAVAAAVAAFRDFAEQARLLEDRPVPPEARAARVGNVVALR